MNRNDFEVALYEGAHGLTGTEVRLLAYYAFRKNWTQDTYVWGSSESIAKKIRAGTRTVERARAALEEQGWIVDTGERKQTKLGRPLVVYDLAIPDFPVTMADKSDATETADSDFPAKSEGLSRHFDETFPPNVQDFPATVADEQDKEQDKEPDREPDTTVPDGPVPNDSPNNEVREGEEGTTEVPLTTEDEATLSNYEEQGADLIAQGKRELLVMSDGARKQFKELAKIYEATEQETFVAAAHLNSVTGYGFSDKCEAALAKAGVAVEAKW